MRKFKWGKGIIPLNMMQLQVADIQYFRLLYRRMMNVVEDKNVAHVVAQYLGIENLWRYTKVERTLKRKKKMKTQKRKKQRKYPIKRTKLIRKIAKQKKEASNKLQ